jgi:hypothetical protein
MNLQSIIDWLLTLPQSTLLPVMGLLAAAENIFPPIPAHFPRSSRSWAGTWWGR